MKIGRKKGNLEKNPKRFDVIPLEMPKEDNKGIPVEMPARREEVSVPNTPQRSSDGRTSASRV